jgi:formiminotetrahydrofolate cyclodeaminase
MLKDLTITNFLDALSSADPTPGGGSAAALVGATGASLLAMVAGMPKSRTNAAEERSALDSAHPHLLAHRATLLELIDRDASAYDLVIAAFRLPKATDEEKAERRAAVQKATQIATEVPLDTIRACVETMRTGRAVAAHGNQNAASDVKVGYRLLMAAAEGAQDNVEINLGGLTDAGVQTRIREAATALMTEADTHLREITGRY